ncbi:hypothetical protein [Hydromonas duriensis]|uniref:Uncharacterized protein n=1 Tax=Hydromonas duriensis TaxID=1527608 RepID=A0A4R6YAF8_9BURK|nr:hypothetical protein [Hydromonas duriensis]TDR32515.1 hypothetical protein DFR44_10328 [Hydromonas duriensis]
MINPFESELKKANSFYWGDKTAPSANIGFTFKSQMMDSSDLEFLRCGYFTLFKHQQAKLSTVLYVKALNL